jgi:hypothetical protein
MNRKVHATLKSESISCRHWLRRIRSTLLCGFIGMLIALSGSAFSQVPGSPEPSVPAAPTTSSVTPNNQTPTLTKLAPEAVLAQMNNGIGQATIVYARKAGEAAPALDWTDAIGPANSIAKDKIKVVWVGQPRTVEKYETVTLSLSVDTRDWVEPNVAYKGRIIFIWPNAGAQTENFTITNTVVSDLSISRSKIDAVIMSGQPTNADLIVSNIGKEKITKVVFSSIDLEDSTTHRRADFGPAQSLSIELEPGGEQLVALTLPRPSYAGTYIGTLNVIANERVRKSIPLSVITRGPTFGRWNWLPFVLFFLTLLVGYLLSIYLEQWFGLGGLERAQALVTLERANSDLVKTLEKVRAWEKAHPGIELDAAKVRADGEQRELSEILEHPNRHSNDELKANVSRFTTSAAAGTILYLKVETATGQWHTIEKLKPVIDALDAVPFPAAADGVDKYRAALDKVFTDHVNTQTLLPAGAPMPSSEILSERVSAEQLEIKIERMNLLKRFVVAVVVLIMGYMTLYWKDPDFGTLPDYFAVLLWALGLSTTGTSILTSAKSSYTRPT